MIELKSIYLPSGGVTSVTLNFLYDLLGERDETTNISHVSMPTSQGHAKFVLSKPYREWWLIVADGEPVGAAYLSRNNEIGLFILRAHRGKGYGKEVIGKIKEEYGDCPLLANINPKNASSISLFEGAGFKHIQNTYRFKN